MGMSPLEIARIAHETNRAYAASLGDNSIPSWEDAPEYQKSSTIKGVNLHLANPETTPEQSHASWLAGMLENGWTYGPIKDVENKEHPCIMPYESLPTNQKSKDYLFKSIVHSLSIYV